MLLHHKLHAVLALDIFERLDDLDLSDRQLSNTIETRMVMPYYNLWGCEIAYFEY